MSVLADIKGIHPLKRRRK